MLGFKAFYRVHCWYTLHLRQRCLQVLRMAWEPVLSRIFHDMKGRLALVSQVEVTNRFSPCLPHSVFESLIPKNKFAFHNERPTTGKSSVAGNNTDNFLPGPLISLASAGAPS